MSKQQKRSIIADADWNTRIIEREKVASQPPPRRRKRQLWRRVLERRSELARSK